MEVGVSFCSILLESTGMSQDQFQVVHTKSEKLIEVFVKETAASSSTDVGHETHLLEGQMEVEDKLLGMNSASKGPLMPVVSSKQITV